MKLSLTKWNVWTFLAVIFALYFSQLILFEIFPLDDLVYKLHFNPVNIIVMSAIYYLVLLWIYQVGYSLDKVLDHNVRLDFDKFKICFWAFAICLFVENFQNIIISLIFDNENVREILSSVSYQIWSMAIVFIEFFAFLYLCYFIARSLKTYASKATQPIVASEYLLFFIFMFLLQFGGIIFLQPFINKIEYDYYPNSLHDNFVDLGNNL